MPEKTTHRHWFGAAWRGLAGVAAVAVLLYFQFQDPERIGQILYAALVVLVALVTFVWVLVYSLPTITRHDSGILVKNYPTLFWPKVAETDWNTVQSVEYDQPGIFAGVFGYGTLKVQTADGHENISMTYVPDVAEWRDAIDDRANTNGPPTGDSSVGA